MEVISHPDPLGYAQTDAYPLPQGPSGLVFGHVLHHSKQGAMEPQGHQAFDDEAWVDLMAMPTRCDDPS